MITREEVQDLHEGDVVELSGHPALRGAVLRGPLYVDDDCLMLGDYAVRYSDGQVNHPYASRMHLTVVSRAPRPLYVNSDRTEPVPGDVVRRHDQPWMHTWFWGDDDKWHSTMDGSAIQSEMPGPLRLLVDGETGLPPAVQS